MKRIALILTFMGLSLAALPAAAQDTDTLTWARASTCPLIRDYISRFPNGRYVGTARTQLQARNCPDPEADARRRAAADAAERARLENAARAADEERARAEREARDLREQLAAARRAAEKRQSEGTQTTTTTTQSNRVYAAYDPAQLNPDIRRAVEAARANEIRSNAAATRARGAAQTGAANAGAGRPQNGFGRETYSNGGVYNGQFVNGLRSGVGVYTYEPGNAWDRYEGEWSNGQFNGYGLAFRRNNDSVTGGYVSDQLIQPAVYRFADGTKYEGEYANSTANGYGVTWTASGQVLSAGIYTNGYITTPLSR